MQADEFLGVRVRTVELASGLSPEDCQVQSMPDASPVKWHLAHTSWFFATFVLREAFRLGYETLFNSYYHGVGPMGARAQRGLMSRPTLAGIYEYRAWVDERVAGLLATGVSSEVGSLIELGVHHEQQHQELILTDVLHAFSLNPLKPVAISRREGAAPTIDTPPAYVNHPGGVVEIGAGAEGFAFDNERPRHEMLLQPYSLCDRPVSNGEYIEFIRDGGYADPRLWLSDGWAFVAGEGITRPLYWTEDLESSFTLSGERPLDPAAPVRHVSHYEADAFARWAGARLPTEFEWEHAMPAGRGSVWEWTSSAYLPYPGFRVAEGAVGEYNGKFMSGQMVLRGGSSATPAGHWRPSYRNFFPPSARWQFAGLRLARDA